MKVNGMTDLEVAQLILQTAIDVLDINEVLFYIPLNELQEDDFDKLDILPLQKAYLLIGLAQYQRFSANQVSIDQFKQNLLKALEYTGEQNG